MVGETNRAPFDLAEAEGELVGGFHTEYSSLKFALFFLAEYVNMVTVSALATTLFLGGWRAPWPISAVNDGMFNAGYWPFLWFIAKVMIFIFIFIWLRGTLPRLRYDQFMAFGWKLLIPISLVWIVRSRRSARSASTAASTAATCSARSASSRCCSWCCSSSASRRSEAAEAGGRRRRSAVRRLRRRLPGAADARPAADRAAQTSRRRAADRRGER